MSHPFFTGIDFKNLLNSAAPFVPQPSNMEDTDYFDSRTERPPSIIEDMQNAKVSGGVKDGEFGNFAYKRYEDERKWKGKEKGKVKEK